MVSGLYHVFEQRRVLALHPTYHMEGRQWTSRSIARRRADRNGGDRQQRPGDETLSLLPVRDRNDDVVTAGEKVNRIGSGMQIDLQFGMCRLEPGPHRQEKARQEESVDADGQPPELPEVQAFGRIRNAVQRFARGISEGFTPEVKMMPCDPRRYNAVPMRASSARTCLLMGPTVTFNSSAARVLERWRAAASNARTAWSGGKPA